MGKARLLSCGVCGHQVSSTAKQCPSCGARFKKKTTWYAWAGLIIILMPFVITMFNKLTGSKIGQTELVTQPQQVTNVQTEQVDSVYKSMDKYEVEEANLDRYLGARVAVARGFIKNKMKDSKSTQYRNIRAVKADKNLPLVVCGELSSKDGYGIQTDFKKFLFKTDNADIAVEGTNTNFEKNYQKYCILK